MQPQAFEHMVDALVELSRQQLGQLIRVAQDIDGARQAAQLIETARLPQLACPRCAGQCLYRHGMANDLQRFRCRAFGRTFNALTGTPLARLRLKSRWRAYCQTLLDPGTTVRRSAEQLEVHRTTTFRWRHRMLSLPKHDRQTPLAGIVEADEMYVLKSQKGARRLERPARKRGGRPGKRGISREQVCVLEARDRSGRTIDAVPGKGPLTAAQLEKHLAPVLAPDCLLVTDGHAAYRAFAGKHGIRHDFVTVSKGEHVRGDVHVQNVNA